MEKLLFAFVHKPVFLDRVLLVLLAPFTHYLITLRARDTLAGFFTNPYYWLAFSFTYCCGMAVILYVRYQNNRLNRNYGIEDDWTKRLSQHLKWNVLVPILCVLLAVTIYFAVFGENIISRSYFFNELPMVVGSVLLVAASYFMRDLFQYFHHRDKERESFLRFHEEWLSENPEAKDNEGWQEGNLPVEDKYGRTSTLNPREVGLLHRYNRKTFVHTIDGQVYTVVFPKKEMEEWAIANGALKASQWFFVTPWSVAGDYMVTTKGINIPIIPSINIGKNLGLEFTTEGETTQVWVCVSKRLASRARKWCEASRLMSC